MGVSGFDISISRFIAARLSSLGLTPGKMKKKKGKDQS